ncbi:pre-mrna-splicing factor slu7 [Gossypium australe]|uniref:Pre-mrna-splicing factor slu7 n=1 Tax=Gossypium australe TaxID=47621 RepID=A0A5B6WVE2_9ROSI|nr:pre-mrna-splicing factor slu7 [Gossypium australe]
MVATEYERCIRFEDSLRDNLRALIAPQKERDFTTLVDKAKITEEVKRTERQNRERGRNKRDLKPSSSIQKPKKKSRVDGAIRVGVPIAATGQPPFNDCGRHHLGECWKRTGACLRCCSLEHRTRDCSWMVDQMQALDNNSTQPPRVVQQLVKGRGQARGGNGLGCGQRALGRGASHTEARQLALVYAVRHREDGDASDVITGTFFIHNAPYTALIDIGSTHSYIACTVSKNSGILVESTTSEVTVLSLLRQSIRVNKLFRDIPLEVQGAIFLADMMELPFGEFDLVLGMDWRTEVVLIGERRNYLSNVIFALRAEKLVRSRDSLVKDIRTIKDFPYIFPEELPRLPLNREVEFKIELIHGTAPVAIAPYGMAPKELIQELLYRGFIRPSVSPWGAPIRFVKKKDRSMRMCIYYRCFDFLQDRHSIRISLDSLWSLRVPSDAIWTDKCSSSFYGYDELSVPALSGSVRGGIY